MKSVRSRSSCASSARIARGWVVSSTWKRSARERARAAPRARARSRPCRAGRPRRRSPTTLARRARSSGSASLAHPGGLVEPAEPARLVLARPDGRVARPDPRDELSPLGRHRRRQLAPLGLDARDQLVERVGELLHALALERRDDVVVVDAGRGELGEQLLGLRDALEHRVAAHLAVVAEGLERLGRHRVDGVGADQLLDVHHVAVGRVLGRGRGPERPLLASRPRRRARSQLGPAKASWKCVVGEPGVRDRRACPASSRRARARRAARRPRCRGARRRTRRPSCTCDEVAAVGGEAREPALVGGGDLAVARRARRSASR